MATLARLFDFIPGDVIRSADVDSEFNQLVNVLNGTTVDKQIILRLNDAALATLIIDQTTATSTSRIVSWKANGIEKVFCDGLGRVQSTVVGTKGALDHDAPASGNVPVVVASTARIINLNADMLDGHHASEFALLTGAQTLTGNVTISTSAPMITLNDTDVPDSGDLEFLVDTDGTDQQAIFRRKSDAKKIQRWNITQGTSQFHNVVALRKDDGTNVDITQSVGGSDPAQHLTTKKYVDDAIVGAGGSVGSGALFDPSSFRLLQMYVKPTGTTVTRPTLAEDALTVIGNALTNADDSLASWVKGTSNAVATAREALVSAATIFETRWDGELTMTVMIPTITGLRFFAGVATQDISALGSSTPNDQCALFRYATDVDGTAFWRTYTAGGASNTVTTTTVAIVAGTKYRLRVRWTGGGTSVKFFIDDVVVATHTTNLPTVTTAEGLYLGLQTLDGVAKAFQFSYAGAWMK